MEITYINMKIRDYSPIDFDEVKKLSDKYNIPLPNDGKMLVAQDDSGKIVGFIIARAVLMIEPMVCENSLAAKELFDSLEWWINTQKEIHLLRAFIKPKHKGLLEKLGFKRQYEKHLIMEKIYR